MGEIVNLSDYRNPGNGTREVVGEYFHRVLALDQAEEDALAPVDHFLAWLWNEGYRVTPVK